MEHLYNVWESFAGACRTAGHVLVLADYDGTLTPIVSRPQDAVLSGGMKQKLEDLAASPTFSLGVISGRELAEVRELVGIEGVYYAGNHGLEISGPGFTFINPAAEQARPLFRELAERLEEALQDVDGAVIQQKGLSLSVHYRLVRPDRERDVETAVRRLTAPHVHSGDMRMFQGKKVWEIRPPVEWDKGQAVQTIRREVHGFYEDTTMVTVFLGDDTTDEDAFRVVRPPDGWSVYVGGESAASAADYCLDSTAEVEELFERLLTLA